MLFASCLSIWVAEIRIDRTQSLHSISSGCPRKIYFCGQGWLAPELTGSACLAWVVDFLYSCWLRCLRRFCWRVHNLYQWCLILFAMFTSRMLCSWVHMKQSCQLYECRRRDQWGLSEESQRLIKYELHA